MAQNVSMNKLVDAALAANSTAAASNAVVSAGEGIIMVLTNRLKDAKPRTRDNIIALLSAISTPAIIAPLLPLMSDDDLDTRERAARAVYAAVINHGAPKTTDFDDAIIASLGEKPSASSLLLAGFVAKAQAILTVHSNDTHLVKLTNAGPSVPAKHAAILALSLLGESQARTKLETSINTDDHSVLEFYLSAIALIDEPSTINTLAAVTLANKVPIAGDQPSGAAPTRRLADRAVEIFTQHLGLKPSFTVDSSIRYSEQNIQEIKLLIENKIPQ